MGRPTKYDPSYCEKVIEWGKAGKAKVDFVRTRNYARDAL